MSIVVTYGRFDLFHFGHANLLQRASSFGIILLVGVPTN